jgi:TonB family protein
VSVRGTAAAGLLFAACATDLAAPAGSLPRTLSPDDERACFERTRVREYLGVLQREVIEAWTLPRRADPDGRVQVEFQLGAQGELLDLRVLSSSDPEVARSAVAAFRRALPIGSPDGGAECLTQTPVTATFSNPLAPR